MPKNRNEIEAMVRTTPYAYIAEYDADNNVEYEAWADPGTAATTAKWICAKHTYSSLNLTKTQWAQDSDGKVADFTNLASSLSTLTYA
jgi:hypothetical protein